MYALFVSASREGSDLRNSIWSALLALAVLFALVWLKLRLTADLEPPAPALAAEAETSAPGSAPLRLRVLDNGELLSLALEDYVLGVTAAEMPADFEPEALKAQAAAARTYAVYCARSGRHQEADVCTNPGCCQAWLSDEALRERWGEAYPQRHDKLAEAVAASAGEILCYGGQAVFAAFHSSSAGFTEDCGAIWSELPYLKSVFSPEGPDSVPNYVTRVEQSPLDFRDTLLSLRPEADFSGPADTWLGPAERDASGRTAFCVIGGARFAGTELRSLFSLRSTAFTLALEDGVFVFTVTGFGHGVGMSQYGAEVMARQGKDFRQILAHYYPGTELQTLLYVTKQ